jgi:hypothetical protein
VTWISWTGRLTRSTLLVIVLCMLGFPAPSSAAQLDIVVNGPGTIVATIPDARDPESARVVCTTADDPEPFAARVCNPDYLPGRVVTLTAQSIPVDPGLYSFGRSSFGTWSDDRCPPTPVCELPIDSDRQSVAASFSPQKVTVLMTDAPQGPGRVTSMPPGSSCEALRSAPRLCFAVFPLFTTVQLIAEGAEAWRGGCDTVVGSTCTVIADQWRVTQLLFPGGLLGGRGGGFQVQFRVAKDGSGSGTVQSDHLACGDTCSKIVDFGTRDTLKARPNDGSRFAGWRGACGDGPNCSLALGPVTRVTAVFEREPETGSRPSSAPPSQAPPARRTSQSKIPSFVAVVGRRVVVRGVRPRRIRFTVRVSARSSIRGVLQTARGRRVITARTWRIPRGRRVLRLAVPRRARRGTYVLRITASDGRGHVKQFNRRVRLSR